MSPERQQIHLFVERLATHGEPSPAGGFAAAQSPPLVVPHGLAWVRPGGASPPLISVSKPEETEQPVLLEQVTHRGQPRLLLVRPGAIQAYLNGQPAPRFCLLKEKDTLRLNGDFLLHVTVYNRPAIGPADAKHVGRECPICRVPFAASSRCYHCPCGAVMHCEEGGSEESLQCAQLRGRSGCPACQRPIVLEPGYSYVPEGIDE